MVDSLDDRSGRPGAWSASGSSSPSLLAQATKAFAFSSSTNEDEPSHPVPDPQALQLISSPFPRVESWLMLSLCWSFCLTFWPSFRTWCFLYLRWDGNYWMSDLVDNALPHLSGLLMQPRLPRFHPAPEKLSCTPGYCQSGCCESFSTEAVDRMATACWPYIVSCLSAQVTSFLQLATFPTSDPVRFHASYSFTKEN